MMLGDTMVTWAMNPVRLFHGLGHAPSTSAALPGWHQKGLRHSEFP